jgi:hypothetical protein
MVSEVVLWFWHCVPVDLATLWYIGLVDKSTYFDWLEIESLKNTVLSLVKKFQSSKLLRIKN